MKIKNIKNFPQRHDEQMGYVKKQRSSRKSSRSRSHSPPYLVQKPISDMVRHDSPSTTHETQLMKRKYSASRSVSPAVQSKNKMPDTDHSTMEEERPHKTESSPDNNQLDQHQNSHKQVRKDSVEEEPPLVAETRQPTLPLSDSKQAPLPPINDSTDRSVSSALSSSSSVSRNSSISRRSRSPIENNNNLISHEPDVDCPQPAATAAEAEAVFSPPPPNVPIDDNEENKLTLNRADSVVSKRIPRSPSPPYSKQTSIESNKDSIHRELADERRFNIDKVTFFLY